MAKVTLVCPALFDLYIHLFVLCHIWRTCRNIASEWRCRSTCKSRPSGKYGHLGHHSDTLKREDMNNLNYCFLIRYLTCSLVRSEHACCNGRLLLQWMFIVAMDVYCCNGHLLLQWTFYFAMDACCNGHCCCNGREAACLLSMLLRLLFILNRFR